MLPPEPEVDGAPQPPHPVLARREPLPSNPHEQRTQHHHRDGDRSPHHRTPTHEHPAPRAGVSEIIDTTASPRAKWRLVPCSAYWTESAIRVISIPAVSVGVDSRKVKGAPRRSRYSRSMPIVEVLPTSLLPCCSALPCPGSAERNLS